MIKWLLILLMFTACEKTEMDIPFKRSSVLADKVDIGIFNPISPNGGENPCSYLKVYARPAYNFSAWVDNIQFTIRWKHPDVNVESFTSIDPEIPFSIGWGTGYNGVSNYACFVTLCFAYREWKANEQYLLMTVNFTRIETEDFDDFQIVNDSWTYAHNGDYYFEINGVDKTGIVYNQATGTYIGVCE
jgi:hypothetical protein